MPSDGDRFSRAVACGYNVHGTVPIETFELLGLSYLEMFQNPISGSVPMPSADFSGLQTLFLDGTKVSGTLSADFWTPQIVSISIRATQISGSIPNKASLEKLQNVGFTFAPLSGELICELSG